MLLVPEQQCNNGSIRLVGGNTVHTEGRVELCNGGSWTSICPAGWDSNEARVVCRQLGYTTIGIVFIIHFVWHIFAGNHAYMHAGTAVSTSFGKGPHPDYINGIYCTGDELDILSCSLSTAQCFDSYDAGVICERK